MPDSQPTVVSLFAGIGGFDLGFQRAGFKVVAHVEIDANCRRLLAARWPDAVALDDVCTAGKHNLPQCDVVVGGSPCQSFSVAGLRKGLNDPRGNLLLEYLRVVSELRPKWLLWENVPGVLSDKTKALDNMLDALEELGYIVDVEIIDAQWNGVAQRRRRVFVCGKSVESLASETTSTSALVIAQCLTEILHGILDGTLAASGEGPSGSVSPKLSSDGLNRRIRLFKLHGETGNLCQTWRNCLDAAYQKSVQEPGGLVADRGVNRSTCTEDGQPSGAATEKHSTPTGPSWSDSLDAAFGLARSYTTLTETSSITPQTIFMCSWAVLHIARLIARLNTSCPPFFAAASSSLTALKEYIGYARHTSSDLFGDPSGVRDWVDFIRQAEQASNALGDIGVECFGTLLPLKESLRGHPAPSREAGQEVAGSLESRTDGGGFPGTGGACSRHVVSCPITGNPYGDHESRESLLIPAVAACLNPGAHPGGHNGQDDTKPGHLVPVAFDWQSGGDSRGLDPKDTAQLQRCQTPAVAVPVAFGGDVAWTLNARHDSSPCADRGMDVVAVPVAFEPRCASNGRGMPETVVPPLKAQSGRTGKGDSAPCVAFHQNQRAEVTTNDTAGSLKEGGGKPGQGYPAAMIGMQVRRLTPTECERLQGFPDGWTEGFSESTRYRMLGNAVCVSVSEWIARRMAAHEFQT